MSRTMFTITALGLLAAATAGCTAGISAFERGVAQYHRGEHLFAAESFTEAIRRNPDSAAAYTNRAITRVRLGDLGAAVADYNRAIQIAPGDAEIYFNRGNALVAAGQPELAIADFTRAVELRPGYARALFNRGSARGLTGQREAAMQDWVQAIELESDPWARASMRRSAGLEPPVAAAPTRPAGTPTQEGTVAPPPAPGTAEAAVPLPKTAPPAAPPVAPPVAAPGAPPQQPAASPAAPMTPQAIDARALATRAISRELDGDHAGALQDLRTAITLETNPGRRQSLQNLLRLLEAPR